MQVLRKLFLIICAGLLLAAALGAFLPFLESIQLLPASRGHGLGGLGYLLTGAGTGGLIGILSASWVVLARPEWVSRYFLGLIVITFWLLLLVYISVQFFDVRW